MVAGNDTQSYRESVLIQRRMLNDIASSAMITPDVTCLEETRIGVVRTNRIYFPLDYLGYNPLRRVRKLVPIYN